MSMWEPLARSLFLDTGVSVSVSVSVSMSGNYLEHFQCNWSVMAAVHPFGGL
jgi:hypothetical protein